MNRTSICRTAAAQAATRSDGRQTCTFVSCPRCPAARSVSFVVLVFIVSMDDWAVARAAEAPMTPSLVCAVKNAIRRGERAWSPEKCARVARAFNRTDRPLTVAGIAINESDWRDRAIAWTGENAADVGLMGVHCLLGKDRRCTNGLARGYSVAQLMNAKTNIAVGAAILASKASLGQYNGKRYAKRYAQHVSVLVEALRGVHASANRIKGKRLRKLVDQITAAVRNEQESREMLTETLSRANDS